MATTSGVRHSSGRLLPARRKYFESREKLLRPTTGDEPVTALFDLAASSVVVDTRGNGRRGMGFSTGPTTLLAALIGRKLRLDISVSRDDNGEATGRRPLL